MPRWLWYDYHKKNNGFNDVFGRMTWDEPSPTITTGCCNPTKGRFLHPQQNRAITPREAARLQTFPDDFVFSGGPISNARQIGNAFPPLYAEKLGKKIMTAIAFPGC
jgi:DNA (cytosine-5)-methyltransferase 1